MQLDEHIEQKIGLTPSNSRPDAFNKETLHAGLVEPLPHTVPGLWPWYLNQASRRPLTLVDINISRPVETDGTVVRCATCMHYRFTRCPFPSRRLLHPGLFHDDGDPLYIHLVWQVHLKRCHRAHVPYVGEHLLRS